MVLFRAITGTKEREEKRREGGEMNQSKSGKEWKGKRDQEYEE